MIALAAASGCGGSSGSDCGKTTQRANGARAYPSVDGHPVVRGNVSCQALKRLAATVKKEKGGPNLAAALKQNGGWLIVPDRYQTVGRPRDFVVGRRGGVQVAFDPRFGL